MNNYKQIFILINGAWHGSWCWRHVAPLLLQAGHKVIPFELAGHGKNQESFFDIHLSTYVNEIINLVVEQKSPVTLVGHSFGGVIISQVAEKIPNLITKLIYIAALIPTNNHSCREEACQQDFDHVSALLTEKEETNELIFDMSDKEKVKNAFYHCCNKQDFEFALNALQAEPLNPMIEPISISNERFGKVEKTYIECLQDRGVSIENQRRMIKNAGIKQIISLDCDHAPFFSCPEELTKGILIKSRHSRN